MNCWREMTVTSLVTAGLVQLGITAGTWQAVAGMSERTSFASRGGAGSSLTSVPDLVCGLLL